MASISKSDEQFWKEFGGILVLLTVYCFAMYFLAAAIGSDTTARMQSSTDMVVQRIAAVGQVRVGDPAQSTEADASSAQPAASPAAAATTETATETTAAAAGQSGDAVYKVACIACHSTGAAGAPKVGDPAAWTERVALGLETLVANAIKGKGAMPPKGGFVNLSDGEIQAAVEFMLGETGISAN